MSARAGKTDPSSTHDGLRGPWIARTGMDLVTHKFRLDQIEEAHDLFAHQRDGVMKVAIRP
jgi:threonine dehydrogenase-like Zn-dependent dehydrogenase